jgi:hypothetical protein
MSGKLRSYAKVHQDIVPILGNNTTEGTGTGVSVYGYDDVLMIWQQGVSGDTLSGSILWTITFEESNDNSSYTTIVDADLQGGYGSHTIDAAAEDPTTLVRQYTGTKRYVRMKGTTTGTHTNGTPIAAVVLLGRSRKQPVTQPTELGTGTSSG